MKLRIDEGKGKFKYIEVNFWSFMKCQFLVYLALTGMIYSIVFLVVYFIM